MTCRGYYELIGIIVGHLYYFIKYKYQQDFGGAALLQTPNFLYNYFPTTPGRGSVHGGLRMAPPPQRANPQTNQRGRHNWGSGHVLGEN